MAGLIVRDRVKGAAAPALFDAVMTYVVVPIK